MMLRTTVGNWIRRSPVEPRFFLPLGAVAGLIWLFAALSDEVLENETHAVDRAILVWLRVTDDPSRTIGPHWLQSAFVDITSLGGTTVITLLTVISVAYLFTAGRPRLAGLTALSISLGALVDVVAVWSRRFWASGSSRSLAISLLAAEPGPTSLVVMRNRRASGGIFP